MKDHAPTQETASEQGPPSHGLSRAGLRTTELTLLRLQRSAGNAAVGSLLAAPAVQRQDDAGTDAGQSGGGGGGGLVTAFAAAIKKSAVINVSGSNNSVTDVSATIGTPSP